MLIMAEAVGFEPTHVFTPDGFQDRSLHRLGTPPYREKSATERIPCKNYIPKNYSPPIKLLAFR